MPGGPPPPNPLLTAVGLAVAFVALCLIAALGLRLAAELLAAGIGAAWTP